MTARLLAAALIAFAALAEGASATEIRGVVELYTSQGCSACPPADRILGEFARDGSIVALTMPVDYWDYIGWKDTLAKPRHTMRQRAYAKARGDRDVYTPQVVVNGRTHVLGSDRAAIDRALEGPPSDDGTLSLHLTVGAADGKVTVEVPSATTTPASGQVWLCALVKETPVEIGRGENRGKTLTYYNVVRRWVKLGDWDGRQRTFTTPLREIGNDGIDAVAVIVQGGTADSPGTMFGAGVAALH
jgi:hypothetical protein